MPASLVATRQRFARSIYALASFAYLGEFPAAARFAGRPKERCIFGPSSSSNLSMRIPILPTFQRLGGRVILGRALLAVSVWSGVGLFFTGATTHARSPFMLESTEAAPAAVEQPVALELRGIVSTQSGYLFGIYDPTTHQSTWVGLNEQAGQDSVLSGDRVPRTEEAAGNSGWVVRSHDLANDSISGEFQGRPFTLSLKTAKVGALPAFPAAPPAVVVNQPSIDSVSKEIERRRALRMAARPLRRSVPPQGSDK